MKTYASSELPFTTSNAALAFALYLSGIPFADEKQPLVNIYDADILRGLGYSGAVERAAIQAHTEGKPGQIEYGFARTVYLGECLDAFDEQQKTLHGGLVSASDIVAGIAQKLAGGLLSQRQAVCKGVCVVVKTWREQLKDWKLHSVFNVQRRKNEVTEKDAVEAANVAFMGGDFYVFAAVVMDARKAFLELFRRYEPMIRLHRKGKPMKIDSRTKLPGFAAYTPATENEMRRTLGVPTK
jgi:hypothetical protein